MRLKMNQGVVYWTFVLEENQCLCSENLTHCEFGTEHIHPDFNAFLGTCPNRIEGGWIEDLFNHIYLEMNLSGVRLNSSGLLQSVLRCTQEKTLMPYDLAVPASFKTRLAFVPRLSWADNSGKEPESCADCKTLRITKTAVLLYVLKFSLGRESEML